VFTGLTSNPTIVDEAISSTDGYDDGIRDKAKAGKSGEALFVELPLEDPAAIAAAWRRNWEQVFPFFAYPREVRGDRVVI